MGEETSVVLDRGVELGEHPFGTARCDHRPKDGRVPRELGGECRAAIEVLESKSQHCSEVFQDGPCVRAVTPGDATGALPHERRFGPLPAQADCR